MRKIIMPQITAATLFATALLAVAAPAAAKPISASVEVPYGDLDLAQPEHARELDQRLRSAATQVCGQLERTREDLGNVRCSRAALSEARRAVRKPR